MASGLVGRPVFGFDIEPEYQGISEVERQRIETPRDIDGEYQSIVNGYTLPPQWNRRWRESTRAVDVTIGSLTNQHFLIYSRARFETELNETLKFRFIYFSQQDREINQTRHILELSQRLLPWMQFNFYAEMAHFKRDNDLGFAFVLKPTADWVNRLYVTYHDFTRGNHNDQADRFVGENPLSVGFTGDYKTGFAVLRGGFRFDRSIGWSLPQEGTLFGYEKRLAFFEAEYAVSDRENFGLRAQWDSTFKGRSPLTGSTTVIESWRTNRTMIRASYLNGTDEEDWSIEPGFMYALRHWVNQSGAVVYHQSYLPSVVSRLRSVRREEGFDHVQLTVEATDFHTYGDVSQTPTNQKHESLEGRLQTAYEFSFRNSSRLLIAFNFDLDEWIRVPTFEGGNVQFRTDF